jgi:hypothetical protein
MNESLRRAKSEFRSLRPRAEKIEAIISDNAVNQGVHRLHRRFFLSVSGPILVRRRELSLRQMAAEVFFELDLKY